MCLNTQNVGSGPQKINSNVLLFLSNFSILVQDCRLEVFLLLWDFAWCKLVVGYRRCGATYWAHLQGSNSPRRMSENR